MSDTRTHVIDALQLVLDIRNNPRVASKLASGEDVAFSELEIDSLTLFELVMQLEDRLGLSLNADVIAETVSIDVLVDHLSKLVVTSDRHA